MVVGTIAALGADRGSTLIRSHTQVSFKQVSKDPAKQLSDDAMGMIANNFGIKEPEVVKCRNAFLNHDLDGSHLIDTIELQAMMADLGEDMTLEELHQLVKGIDKDSSGQIDFIEFVQMYCRLPGQGDQVLEHHVNKLISLVNSEEARKNKMTPKERAWEDGARASSVKDYLRKEMSEADACMQLPFSITLFVVYALAVCVHEQFWTLFAVDETIGFDISENANFAFSGIAPFENGRMGFKTFQDVNNIPDFWSWLGMGLVPMLWVELWDASEIRANVMAMCADSAGALEGFGYAAGSAGRSRVGPLFEECPEAWFHDPDPLPPELYGEEGSGMYLYFNRVVGGVRLRQERRDEAECAGPATGSQIYGAPCYPSDYWLRPDVHSGLYMNHDYVDGDRGRSLVLRKGLSQAEIRQTLMRLEDEMWLSPATQKLELSFVTYNGHLDVLTVTYINFFFNRGGHIIKQLEPLSMWMTPYKSFAAIMLDVVWVAMVLKMFCSEAWDICVHIRQLGPLRGLIVYAGFWNIVDWASIILAFNVMQQFLEHTLHVGEIFDELQTASLGVPGSWEDEDRILDFYRMVDEAAAQNIVKKRFLAIYPFVMAARCFKAFNSQPRLAMVTKTLAASAVDILHFGFVTFTVFLVFVMSGMVLFGEEVEDFAHIDRAVITCWRLILGDFTWHSTGDGGFDMGGLRVVGRIEGFIWFFVFTLLVLQIMLNMLLAVIMDIYPQVKADIMCQHGDVETLWSQAYEIYVRWRDQRRGLFVPFERVLKVLDPTDLDASHCAEPDVQITVEELMHRVDGLGEEQAEAIVVTALRMDMARSVEGGGMAGAVDKIHYVHDKEDIYVAKIDQLLNLCKLLADKVKGNKKKEMAGRKSGRPSIQISAVVGSKDSLDLPLVDTAPRLPVARLPPRLPPKLADALERAALSRVDCRLRSLAVERDMMVHRAEAIAKGLDTRLATLDRKVTALAHESQRLANGREQGVPEFLPRGHRPEALDNHGTEMPYPCRVLGVCTYN